MRAVGLMRMVGLGHRKPSKGLPPLLPSAQGLPAQVVPNKESKTDVSLGQPCQGDRTGFGKCAVTQPLPAGS